MNPIRIMQIADTLHAGGLERMAVNLANHLPRGPYHSHLCVTREPGPLLKLVAPHVNFFHVGRLGRFDARALNRLIRYIAQNRIQILHAHGTSLFISVMASFFKPHPLVVWHDHFGRSSTEVRPVWLYGPATRTAAGVITVSQSLAEWARERLQVRPERIWRIPNFAHEPEAKGAVTGLPGKNGFRIVCVANLRREKDHLNLLRAMSRVAGEFPEAHLLLLGSQGDGPYFRQLQSAVCEWGLASHVSWLGSRNDVAAILNCCDVGVLSSASEGLPLALIEYGMAGLPVVATRVGQCAEVLDQGQAGLLVPPGDCTSLANAILCLLKSPEKREDLRRAFRLRTRQFYSAGPVMEAIRGVYETVLNRQGKG